MNKIVKISLLLGATLISTFAFGAVNFPKLELPDSVSKQNITIWSDGRALDGDIYRPKQLSAEQIVPAIVTSHGWGGTKETAARYAAKFADAGYIVVTFTHSSWGESDGNRYKTISNSTESIHTVRHVIDPIDWIQNVRSAVDYLEGEPNVDTNRIGAWGTSFGGGIVVANASQDERIKSIVTQVAAFPSADEKTQAHARQRAIDIARGKIAPIPEKIDVFPGLDGSPNLARFLQYKPLDAVNKIQVPILLIVAENENYFRNEDNSGKAYEALTSNGLTKVEYRTIDNIDHYGIYFDGYKPSSKMALDWFDNNLK